MKVKQLDWKSKISRHSASFPHSGIRYDVTGTYVSGEGPRWLFQYQGLSRSELEFETQIEAEKAAQKHYEELINSAMQRDDVDVLT